MDYMTILRFLRIPNLVRGLISTIASLLIFIMPCSMFTSSECAAKYMLRGDETFRTQPGSGWTAGFAKAVLTPADVTADTYYIAGYYSDNPAIGVLDDMYARAVYLDDNTGRGGVILCAVDCVGLSRADINDIRRLVLGSGKIPDVKSINIASTHSHAAIDTQGLWGKDFYLCGRNKAFMKELKQKTAALIKFYFSALALAFILTIIRIAASIPFCTWERFSLLHNIISLGIYFAAGLILYLLMERRLKIS